MKAKTIAGNLLAITLMLGLSQATLAAPDKKGPPDPDPTPLCEVALNVESHNHVCATELRLVAMAIYYSDTINPRDESKMLLKLCEADAKYEIEKFDDAVQKLNNISNTALTKKKLDPVEASNISGAALSAADAIANGTCYVAPAP